MILKSKNHYDDKYSKKSTKLLQSLYSNIK